ncbi:MAG: pyrroline-5-carboxylate reductase [bacterium]
MIGFIGAGKMAEGIIVGLLRTGADPASIHAADLNAERLHELHQSLGIHTTGDNRAVAAACQTLVLAVKPQQLDALCQALAPCIGADHLVLSIAAGKRLERLEALLPKARLIRVMPNLACTVGEGLCAIACGTHATKADRDTAQQLLEGCGPVQELPEAQFDAVTALSGSGPAFFAWVLTEFVRGAEAEGLPHATALSLATQTMRGTARLLSEKFPDPASLIEAVTSHRGTTAAGREVLENQATAEILRATIGAATRRSRELSQA